MLQLLNICKSYTTADFTQTALDNVSVSFRDNEFVAILGPSGSGKTTLLNIVGGLDHYDSGNLIIDGISTEQYKDKDWDAYRNNRIGFVFQSYNLIPHQTVLSNVELALTLSGVSRAERHDRAVAALQKVGLGDHVNKKPSQLSGGQMQRVAIARALVNEPKVLLLDEPLGALDLKLRKEMQGELMRIQKSLKITFIYVTHDQEEALTMSDRVVVMKDGEIQQIGTPQDIYNEPKNAFVADFIGESNIIDGVMYEDFEVEFAGQAFKCVDKGFAENERVDVVIRPEDIIVGDYETSPISGEVESVIFKGVHYEITVDAHGYKWLIHSTQSQPVGAHIGMNVRPEDIHIMKKMEAKAR